MVKEVLQIGESKLTQVSHQLSEQDLVARETQQLIDDLVDTCNSEKDGTAGLSAVQVGVLKRIFVARRIDLMRDNDRQPIWGVFINPKIEILDHTLSSAWEGCLSIGKGGGRLFGPVYRPRRVKVTYLERNGETNTLIAEDYFAHIIQHEYDHLDGKLFLSYISNPSNIWRSDALDAYIDKWDKYPPIE